MTLRESLALLLRRWYVVVAGVLVTLGLVLGVSALVRPVYESSAVVVLLPGTGSIAPGGNPLLFLGGVNQARDVLIRTMQSDQVRGVLLEGSLDIDLAVEADQSVSGPVIVVKGLASSPASASEIRNRAVDQLPRELATLQDEIDVPADTRIQSLVLASDDDPELNERATTRAMLAAGLVGVALTFLAAAFIDSTLLSRAGHTGWRSRRGSRELRQGSITAQSGSEVRAPSESTDGAQVLRRAAPEGNARRRHAARSAAFDEVTAPSSDQSQKAASAISRHGRAQENQDAFADDRGLG